MYNEDVFFSSGCKNVKLNKPDISQRFSQEQIISGKSFGIHLHSNLINGRKNCNCQGVDELIRLNIKD